MSRMADFTNVRVLTASSKYKEIDFQMDTGFPQCENAFQFLIARDGSNDLFVIKKAHTATRTTEVHIYSYASSYETLIFQTATALRETDHSWIFALGVNRDLFAIRKSDNSSEHSQLHVLSHEFNYRRHRQHHNILPDDHKLGYHYEFLVDSNDDLWVIKKQRSPSMTEIHVLSAASGYQTFVQHWVTGLAWTDLKWSFLGVDPSNKDVWVVNKKERISHLYRLTAKSLYQAKEMVPLDFPKLDHRYSFALAPNKTVIPATFDLFVIHKSRTSSPFVTFQVVEKPFHNEGRRLLVIKSAVSVPDDLHAFSWITRSTTPVITNSNDSVENQGFEESYLRIVKKNHTSSGSKAEVSFFRESYRFQGPSGPMITAWPVTDDTCEFLFAKNMDMFVIKKSNCETDKVEVRILSWVSRYQSYTLEVPTLLDEVDHTWTFLLADNLDLICIRKSRTNSKSPRTECLRMVYDDGAGGHYTSWSPKTKEGDNKTALPETDDSWEFLLAPNDDLYAIHKYGTTSKFTDIKVLSADSDWKEITKDFQTALPQTDYNYSFCLTSDLNLVAVQKSRFPFSADMASI